MKLGERSTQVTAQGTLPLRTEYPELHQANIYTLER